MKLPSRKVRSWTWIVLAVVAVFLRVDPAIPMAALILARLEWRI